MSSSFHTPRNPHCVEDGPSSLYPCGHENEHIALISIGDVTQLFGDVWTRRLTFSAGHFIAGDKKTIIVKDEELLDTFRACLHGSGGPQVGEITRLGGVKNNPRKYT